MINLQYQYFSTAVGGIVERKADLLDVIRTSGAPGRFASTLNGREQQADECADDRDHDEQLDERETCPHSISGNTGLLHGTHNFLVLG